MATHISNTLKNMVLGGQAVLKNGDIFLNMGKGGISSPGPSYVERLYMMLANALGHRFDYTRHEWVPPLPCSFSVTELPYEQKIMVVLDIRGKAMRLEDSQENFPSNELIGKIRLLSP